MPDLLACPRSLLAHEPECAARLRRNLEEDDPLQEQQDVCLETRSRKGAEPEIEEARRALAPEPRGELQ